MWLINTTTLKLEHIIDPDEDATEYAILSHTWEKEEVSFQQFQQPEIARKMAGYTKIEKTCRLALDRGFKYAWIDTCCIDKSSSAELSEAINSMFSYYRLAAVCFVYLADFPRVPECYLDLLNYAGMSEKDYEENEQIRFFRNARWFSRGWTLQELIAPRHLIFFNSDWQTIGTKSTFKDLLAKVTGIDAQVLLGEMNVSSVPVAVRMSWAAKRDTTRTEDIAYCLLGIFDVNMPLIYGEGWKAFQRLQEEILRTTNDTSILAWSTDHPVAPKYRPPAYRKMLERPRFRASFAWAPSEFLGVSTGLERNPGFNPPIKMVSVHGSVEITAEEGVPMNVDMNTGNVWLTLTMHRSLVGRRMAMTPYGYAFVDVLDADRTAMGLRRTKVPKLQILSHRDAMRFNLSNDTLLHCLFSTNFPGRRMTAWPTNCYDELRQSWTYSRQDLNSFYSFKLLGMMVHTSLIQTKQGPPEHIDLLFCVGTRRDRDANGQAGPLQLWGINFVKQSKDPYAATVYDMATEYGSGIKDPSIRIAVEASLRSIWNKGGSPLPLNEFQGRIDEFELPSKDRMLPHNMRCYTIHTVAPRSEHDDETHNFEIKFDYWHHTGRWHELRSGNFLVNYSESSLQTLRSWIKK